MTARAVLAFFVCVRAAAARSNRCDSTVVQVETPMNLTDEVKQFMVEEFWKMGVGGDDGLRLPYNLSNNSGFLYSPSSHIQFTSMGNAVQINVLKCNSTEGPAAAYALASSAKHILGGSRLNWSVSASPTPADVNLRHYFGMMGNISEEKTLLASHGSNFSTAEIWRIGGETSMVLNNVIMSSTRDEGRYHEALVHPALLVARSHLQVLIIGGGEGATLREVLQDSRVEKVVMVDIDEGLVKMCYEHLEMMHGGSFNSSKATLVFDDGFEYIQRVPPGTYDVIIVDGIDVGAQYEEEECVCGEEECASQDTCKAWMGERSDKTKSSVAYGDPLFTTEFYRYAHQALHSGGVLVEYISDVEEVDCDLHLREVGFSEILFYAVSIESFPGEGARFALAAKQSEGSIAELVLKGLIYGDRELKHLNVSSWHQALAAEQKLRRLGKGGGGTGTSGGGGSRGWFSSRSSSRTPTRVTRSAATYTGASWGSMVILHSGSRRRYGYYRNEPGSKCNQLGSSQMESACYDTGLGNLASFDQKKCHDCIRCETESCIKSITNCDKFLKRAYPSCTYDRASEQGPGWGTLGFCAMVLLLLHQPESWRAKEDGFKIGEVGKQE